MGMKEVANDLEILHFLVLFYLILLWNICIGYNCGQNNWNKVKMSSKKIEFQVECL